MKKSLTASETRKVCDYFRKLSGAELQAAISLIYKDLPEGKSPRKYAMPSVQQGKIYSIDFADLSNNSLMLLTNYFDARAHQLGLTLPFKGKYADMKGTHQQTRKKNKKQSNKLPIIQASPPSKRELENELSGLSAFTGMKAVDLSNTAQSAYFMYMGSVRDQVRAAYPEYKIGDVTKHIGAMWRQLDPRKREPFEKEAAKLKAQYHRDREEYLANKTDPNKPKRPQSAYFLYMGSVRAEVKGANPNFSIGEVAKEIGSMWRNLSAQRKKPFEKQAAKLKEEYWVAKQAYEEEFGGDDN